MMHLCYRPAGEEDIPVLFHMAKELIDAYEDLSSIDYDRVLAWVKRKITQNITSYICVYALDKKVGFYRLAREPEGTELDDFYILPEYRGKGIGSEILQKIVNEAPKPIFLYVFTANTGAIRLYRRFAFRTTKQVSPTRIIMSRNG